MKTYIIVTFDFISFHNYPDAPEEVEYLRFKHRHKFNVKAKIEVYGLERELEFFIVQKDLMAKAKTIEEESLSCESIAMQLATYIQEKYGMLRDISVQVWEDGENGSEVVL